MTIQEQEYNWPDSMIDNANGLLNQALKKIRNCLNQLNEDQIWWRAEPSTNSIGNLILHICGNLKQWGIVPFLQEIDDRDRESEFSCEHALTKTELLVLTEKTTAQASSVWNQLSSDQLTTTLTVQGFQVIGIEAINHTATHFVGHTHQVILLTRIQLGDHYHFEWSPASPRGSVPI